MKTTLATLLALTLFAASANAGTIFTENFDGWDGTTDMASGGAHGIFTANTFGNLTSFSLNGTCNLLRPSGSSAWLNPVPAELGTTFAVLHTGTSATADLTDTFADNTTYTLTFTHFRRDDLNGDSITAQIMTTGGTVLATDTFAAVTTTDTYVTRTVTHTTSGGSEVDQAIRLQLTDASGGGNIPQAGIDNITLVPEPATFALAALGLLGLRRRPRRQSLT